jgi:hypothetical protein
VNHDLPEPEQDWTSLPAEQVPPWRRADRARLEAARALPHETRTPEIANTAREIRRLADLHAAGALSDHEFVAAIRSRVVEPGAD